MALREYITLADVTNKLFNRFPEATRQLYIDIANEECEDLAKRRDVDPADITEETHFKLKQYLMHFALSQLAQDNVGFNNKDGFQGEDVYESLFKRSQFLLQNLKPEIVKVMFTGEKETPENRSVFSQALYRG